MNYSRFLVLLAGALLILALPVSSHAQEKKSGYITFKPGAYIPQGDLEDKGFDSGFNGEIAVGTYYSPNLALEAGIGYMHAEGKKSGADFKETDDLWVVPVTITAKGVWPFRGGEFDIGGGLGAYFANVDVDGTNAQTGSYSGDDNSVVFGGHGVAGISMDMSEKMFLGVEGKYIFTSGAKFFGQDVDLNGFTVTGVIGLRF